MLTFDCRSDCCFTNGRPQARAGGEQNEADLVHESVAFALEIAVLNRQRGPPEYDHIQSAGEAKVHSDWAVVPSQLEHPSRSCDRI